MRLLYLIRGDIRFQWTYGFYGIYAVLTVLYILILSQLPEGARAAAGALLILTDPAAMGLFFMGAVVLLEKGQNTLSALFVSPVSVDAYMAAKVVSLTAIGTLVGLVLAIYSRSPALPLTLLGLLLGSCFFTLLGLAAAHRCGGLNGFLLLAAPAMFLFLVPGALYILGLRPPLALLHPGVAAGALMAGDAAAVAGLPALLIWTAAAWLLARRVLLRSIFTRGGDGS